MQDLWLSDGQKWFLLSLPGMREHQRLLVVREVETLSGNRRDLWKPLRFGRATERDGVCKSWVWEPRSCMHVLALSPASSESKPAPVAVRSMFGGEVWQTAKFSNSQCIIPISSHRRSTVRCSEAVSSTKFCMRRFVLCLTYRTLACAKS